MQQYIWVIWDVVAVVLLIYFVYIGARHGILRTLVGLLGYAAAFFVARLGSPVAAQKLYDSVVRDAVKLVLTRRMADLLGQGTAAASDITAAIPDSLRRLMGNDALDAAGSALHTEADLWIESLIDSALREPILSLLQGLFFLVIFTLTVLLVRFFSRMFSRLYMVPVLGTVNTLLGGVFGVLEAALVLFVASLALQLLILFSGGGFWWLSDIIMEETWIWRIFYNILRL